MSSFEIGRKPRMTISADRAREILAPGGTLKAALNFSNPVIAVRDAEGQPGGVSAMLSRKLADRLKAELEIVAFGSPVAAFEAARKDDVGIAFLAVEAERARSVAFAPAYVEIEGTYLLPQASMARNCSEVDSPGWRVAVSKGAGYDNHLKRTLKNATIVHTTGMEEAVSKVIAGQAEAAAGIRPALEAFARARSQLFVLVDRFISIKHSVCVPNERREALAFVTVVIAEAVRSGEVARSLADSGNNPAIVVNYPA